MATRILAPLALLVFLLFPGSAFADDTAMIQAAIDSRTPLPAGVFTFSRQLIVGNTGALIGQGIMATRLQPTLDLVGIGSVIDVHADATVWGRPLLRDFGLLPIPGGMTGGVAIYVHGVNGPVDLFEIRGVRVENGSKYALSFFCKDVVSSRMDFSQFWNYQPNTFTAGFHGCTDWTITGSEFHMMAPSPPGGALWSWYGSAFIRLFGGNVSLGYAGQGGFVVGPGVLSFGTEFYIGG